MSSLVRTLAAGCFLLAGCTGKDADPPTQAIAAPETAPSPTQEPTTGDRYGVDRSASHFGARIGVAGVLSALGHEHAMDFREFSGEVRLPEGSVERGSLRMTLQAVSIGEASPKFGEEDRKEIDRNVHEEALEVSKYPRIEFRSTGLTARVEGEGRYQVEIRGELTLHGVTRPVTVPAEITFRDNVLTARGEFTVRHSDFKITRLSAAAGTIKATDEIRLSFEIVARKAP